MTSRRQCPRGGCACERPRVGVFVIFCRADDVTRTMSKGGVLVNVLTPLQGLPCGIWRHI